MRPYLIAKQAIVDEITQNFTNAQSLIVVEYQGLNVQALTDLRRKLRNFNARLIIYKNRLFKRALINSPHAVLADNLIGPNGFIFIDDDSAMAIAKMIATMHRQYKKLKLKIAIIDNQLVERAALLELALLPSKDELLAMFANSLLFPVRKLGIAIKAIANQQQAAAS